MDKTPEEHWRDLSEQILTDITEWRRSQQISDTRGKSRTRVHMRMSRLEAQLIGGYGPAESESSLERSEPARAAHLSCVRRSLACYARKRQRKLQGSGGQEVTLNREYGTCPNCGAGLFPP